MTQLETTYFFGPSMTSDDMELYHQVPVETDVLCLVNYFKSQVLVINKSEFADPTFSPFKMIKIFGWNERNVITEENLSANIDECFKNMYIIRI